MRKFEFLLDPEVPPPTGFGGSKPSRTLIPASSLIVADRRASECPESIVDLPHDKAEYVCSRLADAAAAIEEVLKFMPDGADRIPETAFFAGGRSVYEREPGRFSIARLQAVLDTYRDGLFATTASFVLTTTRRKSTSTTRRLRSSNVRRTSNRSSSIDLYPAPLVDIKR